VADNRSGYDAELSTKHATIAVWHPAGIANIGVVQHSCPKDEVKLGFGNVQTGVDILGAKV
jgi:hypothetical protein